MRLIDADVLIEHIREFTEVSEGYFENPHLLERVIKNQPTAYNVEKVIEHINKIEVERSEYSEMVRCNIDKNVCSSNCYECIINHVDNIVRNGGKE